MYLLYISIHDESKNSNNTLKIRLKSFEKFEGYNDNNWNYVAFTGMDSSFYGPFTSERICQFFSQEFLVIRKTCLR